MKFHVSFMLEYDSPLTASERDLLYCRVKEAIDNLVGVPGIPRGIGIEEIQ